MRPEWYADNRDLIKWAVLLRIADEFKAKIILQIVYLRKSDFGAINLDGINKNIPDDVIAHFRNINSIKKINHKFNIIVYDEHFENRKIYLDNVIKLLSGYKKQRCLVFLDPDTGLEPLKTKHNMGHVLEDELREIWEEIKSEDVLVFYQHKTNMSNKPWIEQKKNQLAKAIKQPLSLVKIAKGNKVGRDVVFFYIQR